MKPIISVLAIASVFSVASCNSSATKEKEALLQAQQQTIDSLNVEMAKKKVIDSMNEVARFQYQIPQNMAASEPVGQTAAVAAAAVASQRASSSRSRTSRSTAARRRSSVSRQPQTVVYQQAPAPKKRGWSAKAKGAVIGAGTGAAAGAIINGRNRGAGAIIGGVLGAGAGTGVGAIIDHKKGR